MSKPPAREIEYSKSTLYFYGGVGTVTGAHFVLDAGDVRFAVDCGLLQGAQFTLADNAKPFPYDVRSLDAVFLTHAHADHIGRVPQLVRAGFRGPFYSTPSTKDLAAVMLADAYEIMQMEANEQGIPPLYERGDIDSALANWHTLPYYTPHTLGSVTITFQNAGHILGSAAVSCARRNRAIFFSGDIGNVPQPLMPPPDLPRGQHYLVMESVYGDRTHEEVEERTELLGRYIRETARRGGTLIIPAFSLERTQAMLTEMRTLRSQGAIPALPVFLDSPLAIAVTDVYRRYTSHLREELRTQAANNEDLFHFPELTLTATQAESARISHTDPPKIIIAGSGMSHGGRIRRHEQHYLTEKKNTLLLVGHQAAGSLGRQLADGVKKVTIDGKRIKVRAQVAHIQGYSGHADCPQLLDYVAAASDTLEHVFVTMGETPSSLALVQRLRDYLGVSAHAPTAHEARDIAL